MRYFSSKTIKVILIFVAMFFMLFSWSLFHSAAYGNPTDTQSELEEAEVEIHQLTEEIEALDSTIQSQLRRMADLKITLQQVTSQLAEAEAGLLSATANLEDANQRLGSRLRSIYMDAGVSFLELLIEAESLADLVIRVEYLRSILEHDALLVETIEEEKLANEQRKIDIAAHLQQIQTLTEEHQSEYQLLLSRQQEKEALLAAAMEKMARLQPVVVKRPFYGIIIDNFKRARPQSGLSRASTIYEFEVEGGITRYLALFAEFPSVVGPIRSARTHSTMLALENDVTLIYTGASVCVLQRISLWGLKHINALLRDEHFWRDRSRRAPHNLYVNLRALNRGKPSGGTTVRPRYLGRKGTPVTTVSVEYNANHRIRYVYNPETKLYTRYFNDRIHREASGDIIRVRNIVVQYAPFYIDSFGRPTPDLIGEGRIRFYSEGQGFTGTWKKEDLKSPTRFYFQDDQRISFPYGQTWIQIMREE